MSRFIRHPKCWLVLVLLLGIEAAFRAGIWESAARPDSYAGTSINLKRAVERFGPERIGTVTLGDSRTVYGFDHRRLLTSSREAGGPVHADLSLPGTHLATLKAEWGWVNDHLPAVERVVVGLSVGSLERLGNGYYEIGMVTPFLGLFDFQSLREHFPPQTGDPRSLGSVSAFMAYRQDVFQALRQPLKRRRQIEKRRSRPPASVLGFRNNRTRDLCELDLRSMDTCLDELARLRAAGRSRDPLAVTMARNCQARPVPSDAVRSRALAAWRDWFETIAAQARVTVVLMPEHSLFHRGSDTTPDTDPGVVLLETLAAEGAIELLDLSATLAEAPNPECAYYSDLVHANVDGMERLTSRLIDHLQGASEP